MTTEEGEQFAKEHGLVFLETSAKTAHNVEEVKRLFSIIYPDLKAVFRFDERCRVDVNPNRGDVERS